MSIYFFSLHLYRIIKLYMGLQNQIDYKLLKSILAPGLFWSLSFTFVGRIFSKVFTAKGEKF